VGFAIKIHFSPKNTLETSINQSLNSKHLKSIQKHNQTEKILSRPQATFSGNMKAKNHHHQTHLIKWNPSTPSLAISFVKIDHSPAISQ
jgi:hypothetical protein